MSQHYSDNIKDENEKLLKDLEVEAAVSFIDKIANNFTTTSIKFHVCRLTDAINEACMVEVDRRKILCLYLHNACDKFSTTFCENLKNMEVAEILNRSFFLLGWDVEDIKYQSALINALNMCKDLSILINMLTSKTSAVLCVVPIKDSVTIFSCIKGKVSDKDFLVALSNAEKFLITENEQEKCLEELAEKTRSENDMDSLHYQKLMANMLGDRDYDSFEYNQHEYLKKKIAFAMLGPPQKEEGYEKQDMKKIQALYESIVKNNNAVTKYKDKVEISFIYNCTEPLPSEKLSRAKKYKEDYNPNTDVMPLPIFVLRKCRGSKVPCRIFVDNTGRSYNTWQEYISKNKLHKCEMILPQDGRYEVNENDEVVLEKYLSPSCGIDSKVLQGADYINAAGGLISGGIFVAAAIPTVAVAPAAIIAGSIIGLGVGIYSLGRGAYTLYDRKKHKETLNFVNSEARGAYLNIVASSLGFVGAGATMVVSQLASMGVNIGQANTYLNKRGEFYLLKKFPKKLQIQGAGAALRTIGLAKMGANSLSILNAGCDVINHWCNENKATLLTVLQLKSSILFFGNVIYSFEMDNVDLKDIKTLQDNQEILRSNRLRKTFLKLLKKNLMETKQKEVEGLIEIIAPIYEIQDRDGVHEVLIRANESLEKSGNQFFRHGKEIRLNDVNIDVAEFCGISKRDFSTLLTNCQKLDPSPEEIECIYKIISDALNDSSLPNQEIFTIYIVQLLSLYSNDIKLKIIDALASLLKKISYSVKQLLDEIFPDQFKYFSLLNMIVCFFGEKSELLEEQYNLWIKTNKKEYYQLLFENVDEDKTNRTVLFFEQSVYNCYEGKHFAEKELKNLLKHFYHWLVEHIYAYQVRIEVKTKRKEHSMKSPRKKLPCDVCGGYYYKNI